MIINADGTDLHQFFWMPEYTDCGSPAWCPDGGKVAFDAMRSLFGEGSNEARIVVVDTAGGAPRDLGLGIRPSWSPDGKRIAFTSRNPGTTGVCTMNADGSDIQQIDPGGSAPVWSPIGGKLAYTIRDENGANICFYDLNTQKRRMLFEKGEYEQVWYGFGWSPDAEWICFRGELSNPQPGEAKTQVAIVHVEGKKKGFRHLYHTDAWSKITGFSNTFAWQPKEGKQILASLLTADNPNKQLFLVDPEGKVPPQRLAGQDPNRVCTTGTWSPAGQRVIFCVRPGVSSPQP